jgi:hypothetical protein
MIKFIAAILWSILFIPAISVSSYVYYKHSLYCVNNKTFDSKYIQIDIKVGQCSAWERSKEEFGEFFLMLNEQNKLFIPGPEEKSNNDEARSIMERLRSS